MRSFYNSIAVLLVGKQNSQKVQLPRKHKTHNALDVGKKHTIQITHSMRVAAIDILIVFFLASLEAKKTGKKNRKKNNKNKIVMITVETLSI
jgi:hypothetical protein